MKKFLLGLLDWIYKKKCYFCGSSKESVLMCQNCYDELEYLPISVNRHIKTYKVYCAGVYSKNLQKLIRGLKYHNQRELAYYQAKFMWEYWQKLNISTIFEIVPVPIYKGRLKKRKYNHMELVAEEFSKFSGYKINKDLITRIKDTKPQYKLNKFQRLENLKDAFKVNISFYTGNPILIIDDICTTGSTFEEMIKSLNESGINEITCFATTTPFEI